MQMLKKIFNSDNKFYLELDESQTSEVVQSAVKAAAVVQEKVAVAQPQSESKVKASAAPSKAMQNGKTADSQETNKAIAATSKKSAASSYEPPFWVAAMNNTNNNGSSNGSGQGAEVTFASDNLMPTITKYRRLPGGSLAKFKAMAKTAKTPRR